MIELLTSSLLIIGLALIYWYIRKYTKNRKMPFSDTLNSNNTETKE